MIEVKDPYKGMKYSDIVALDAEHARKYFEAPHAMLAIPGTGRAVWSSDNSRWVV